MVRYTSTSISTSTSDEHPVDRDDIEDALSELDGFEVVDAGVGASGSNLGVEGDDPILCSRAMRMVTAVLRQFGSHHHGA